MFLPKSITLKREINSFIEYLLIWAKYTTITKAVDKCSYMACASFLPSKDNLVPDT